MDNLKPHDYLGWKCIEDHVVVADEHEGKVYRFNGLGSEIWKLLDGSRDMDEIINCLSHDYSEKENKIRNDVKRFLKQLHEMDLVTSCPAKI